MAPTPRVCAAGRGRIRNRGLSNGRRSRGPALQAIGSARLVRIAGAGVGLHRDGYFKSLNQRTVYSVSMQNARLGINPQPVFIFSAGEEICLPILLYPIYGSFRCKSPGPDWFYFIIQWGMPPPTQGSGLQIITICRPGSRSRRKGKHTQRALSWCKWTDPRTTNPWKNPPPPKAGGPLKKKIQETHSWIYNSPIR